VDSADNPESSGAKPPGTNEEIEACPKCGISLVDRALAQRKQYVRRWARGCASQVEAGVSEDRPLDSQGAAPPPSGGYRCTYCKRVFATYSGMRQHEKRTHNELYQAKDLELLMERTKVKRGHYTRAELEEIARLDIAHRHFTHQSAGINQCYWENCGCVEKASAST